MTDGVVANLINKDSDVHYYTVADATAIAKGTMLVASSDPRVAIAHSAANQTFLGFAVEDKVANDGQTKIGVRRQGVWDIESNGTMAVGNACCVGAEANTVKGLDGSVSNLEAGAFVGICLETASDNEVVNVLVF
jgi:hypothetical protein